MESWAFDSFNQLTNRYLLAVCRVPGSLLDLKGTKIKKKNNKKTNKKTPPNPKQCKSLP